MLISQNFYVKMVRVDLPNFYTVKTLSFPSRKFLMKRCIRNWSFFSSFEWNMWALKFMGVTEYPKAKEVLCSMHINVQWPKYRQSTFSPSNQRVYQKKVTNEMISRKLSMIAFYSTFPHYHLVKKLIQRNFLLKFPHCASLDLGKKSSMTSTFRIR